MGSNNDSIKEFFPDLLCLDKNIANKSGKIKLFKFILRVFSEDEELLRKLAK